MSDDKKILLVGLGNPILGDDGLGWHVVQFVENQINKDDLKLRESLEIEYFALGGLSLMENMIGFNKVIIVDSILTKKNPVGTILSLPLNGLPNFSSGHSTAAHDTSLITALEFGSNSGLQLPEIVWVVAVEAINVFEFSEMLTQPVMDAIPVAAKLIIDLLNSNEWCETEVFEV